jgi:hypothetical protein
VSLHTSAGYCNVIPETENEMKSQTELSSNSIAVWIGNHTDEDQLDDYLCIAEDFSKDFGFLINQEGLEPEIEFGEEKTILDLLKGFSLSDQFVDIAEKKAETMGVKFASSAVIFYGLSYIPSLQNMSRASKAQLQFICNVPT